MDEEPGCLAEIGYFLGRAVAVVVFLIILGLVISATSVPVGLLIGLGIIVLVIVLAFAYDDLQKPDLSLHTTDIPMNPLSVPSIPQVNFDLSNNNIGIFYAQLEASLNSGQPMFLFTKKRRNLNIALDNNYQQLIINKIIGLRRLSEEYINLKADAIFSEQYLENLVRNKQAAADREFELAVQRHKKDLRIIDNDIEADNARVVDIKAEADRKVAENETIRQQNETIRQQAEAIKIKNEMDKRRVDFYDNVISKMDLSTFPPAYQVYIISKFLDMDPDKMSKLDLEEAMKDIILKQAQAEADKKAAEAESANLDNKNKQLGYKRNKDKKP